MGTFTYLIEYLLRFCLFLLAKLTFHIMSLHTSVYNTHTHTHTPYIEWQKARRAVASFGGCVSIAQNALARFVGVQCARLVPRARTRYACDALVWSWAHAMIMHMTASASSQSHHECKQNTHTNANTVRIHSHTHANSLTRRCSSVCTHIAFGIEYWTVYRRASR